MHYWIWIHLEKLYFGPETPVKEKSESVGDQLIGVGARDAYLKICHLCCINRNALYRNVDFYQLFFQMFPSLFKYSQAAFQVYVYGIWLTTFLTYGSISMWLPSDFRRWILCLFSIFGCRGEFYQCYGFPLILSSPFHHLCPPTNYWQDITYFLLQIPNSII